ncbi:MAG: CoA ester lyase [Chromatiales bacterium]|jgi:citrate lyase subunit beta / citryl-CoA lyase|nr:CoA ester lyase [Chromatiales bacterium]
MHDATSNSLRPRRSVLYMPGINARAIAKARTLAADALILDLEDAVAPESKGEARDLIAATVKEGGFGNREVLIRVNGLDTPWSHDDLLMAGASAADGVVLPKIESADAIRLADQVLRTVGPGKALWAMVETPMAVMNVRDIASAGAPLVCLLLGTSDLAKEMRLSDQSATAGLIWSLSQSIVAARAYGLDVIDGVHLNIKDEEGFKSACHRGQAFGFDGKSLIHPTQIAMANETFGLSADEIEHAQTVVSAYETARAEGKGLAVLNGKLIEALHVEQAKRVLAVAQAIEGLAQ